jgi:hypothetical protein
MIVATSNFPEEAESLKTAGADHTAYSFYEVGAGLAGHIYEAFEEQDERPQGGKDKAMEAG